MYTHSLRAIGVDSALLVFYLHRHSTACGQQTHGEHPCGNHKTTHAQNQQQQNTQWTIDQICRPLPEVCRQIQGKTLEQQGQKNNDLSQQSH